MAGRRVLCMLAGAVPAVLLVVVAVASASSTGAHAAPRRVLPLQVHRFGVGDRETLALLRASERARRRGRARALEVSAASRARSRSEYRGLTAREALALGRRKFAAALAAPAFSAARPAPGLRRLRGLSARAEVVSDPAAAKAARADHGV